MSKLGMGGNGREPEPPESDGSARKLPPQHQVEREMLRLVARSPVLFDEFAPRLSDAHFDRAGHRKLFETIRSTGGDIRTVVAEAQDDKLAGQLASLVTERLDGEATREYAAHVAYRLEEFELQRRIDSLKRDLERLNPMTDPTYEERFVELSKLEGARRRVREQAERS